MTYCIMYHQVWFFFKKTKKNQVWFGTFHWDTNWPHTTWICKPFTEIQTDPTLYGFANLSLRYKLTPHYMDLQTFHWDTNWPHTIWICKPFTEIQTDPTLYGFANLSLRYKLTPHYMDLQTFHWDTNWPHTIWICKSFTEIQTDPTLHGFYAHVADFTFLSWDFPELIFSCLDFTLLSTTLLCTDCEQQIFLLLDFFKGGKLCTGVVLLLLSCSGSALSDFISISEPFGCVVWFFVCRSLSLALLHFLPVSSDHAIVFSPSPEAEPISGLTLLVFRCADSSGVSALVTFCLSDPLSKGDSAGGSTGDSTSGSTSGSTGDSTGARTGDSDEVSCGTSEWASPDWADSGWGCLFICASSVCCCCCCCCSCCLIIGVTWVLSSSACTCAPERSLLTVPGKVLLLSMAGWVHWHGLHCNKVHRHFSNSHNKCTENKHNKCSHKVTYK